VDLGVDIVRTQIMVAAGNVCRLCSVTFKGLSIECRIKRRDSVLLTPHRAVTNWHTLAVHLRQLLCAAELRLDDRNHRTWRHP
jgi:biotin carboxylase